MAKGRQTRASMVKLAAIVATACGLFAPFAAGTYHMMYTRSFEPISKAERDRLLIIDRALCCMDTDKYADFLYVRPIPCNENEDLRITGGRIMYHDDLTNYAILNIIVMLAVFVVAFGAVMGLMLPLWLIKHRLGPG